MQKEQVFPRSLQIVYKSGRGGAFFEKKAPQKSNAGAYLQTDEAPTCLARKQGGTVAFSRKGSAKSNAGAYLQTDGAPACLDREQGAAR